MSSAALMLSASSTLKRVSRTMTSSSTSRARLTARTTFDTARPIRFQVSSTRPPPCSGDESRATLNFCQPNLPLFFPNATVRSTSCQGRSFSAASTPSASLSPSQRCSNITIASIAGGQGSCRRGWDALISSSSKPSAKSSPRIPRETDRMCSTLGRWFPAPPDRRSQTGLTVDPKGRKPDRLARDASPRGAAKPRVRPQASPLTVAPV
jgi:hypothetical protein